MIRGVAFFILILFACPVFAADVSLGPSSSGNGNGSDWNNIAQWSTLTFTRGNTYYLQDGTYGAKTLNTETSGSTYIYIKKATESAHGSTTGWNSSYGDGVTTFTGGLTIETDYWDISGVTGGGPESWTSGYGIVFTSAAGEEITYIDLYDGVDHIFIRHISFTQTGDITSTGTTGTAIYNAGSLSNSTIEYCYFNNLVGLPWLLRGGATNIFQYNYTGDICGQSDYNVDNHCEALVLHDMDDVHFRWNWIGECPSTGGFVKNNDSNTADSIRIYGNYFNCGSGIAISVNGPATNWVVVNNTFINGLYPYQKYGTQTGYYYNNLIYGTNIGPLPTTHDYNWFSSLTGIACNSGANTHENITVNYPADCDVCSEISDPFVNSSGNTAEDFQITASSAPRNLGTNFCVLDECTGEKKYNLDIWGNLRGIDGTWDIGAYEYGAGPPPPNMVGITIKGGNIR